MLKQLVGLTLITFLVSCGDRGTTAEGNTPASTAQAETETLATQTQPEASDTATPAATDEATTTASSAPLSSGTHCYTIDNALLTGAVRVTSDSDNQVSGDSTISIHDEANGYYSSYSQQFEGSLSGDQANLAVTTWIEYDRQSGNEIWTITPETLTVGDDIFIATNCEDEAVTAYFTGPDGLEAAELLEGLAPGQRVQFDPGTSGTVLENSVVRGDRDLYVLGADGGQTMYLDITSLEANAVFDVISPSGNVLVRASVSESLLLPERGDYQIIVGGTRGNATYFLDIWIE